MTEGQWFANGITGRHVLISLVVFFGVMLIANGLFVYFALSTFTGSDSDPYRRGLHYNDTLEAAARQVDRGWQSSLRYDAAKRRLSLGLTDSKSRPVTGLQIEAVVGRPVTDKEDHALSLKEEAHGIYSADIDLAPGQWVISAATPDEPDSGEPAYQLKQRLSVGVTP
ncbi:MAG TPA: FixH family protein [Methyloceanibacter sp.]|nr:FixH family protein [Methyloceanibacter sp.]